MLVRFAPKVGVARKALVAFMGEKGAREDRKIFGGGGLKRSLGQKAEQSASRRSDDRQMYDERVLGDGDFVEQILHQIEGDERRLIPNAQMAEEKLHRLMHKLCKSQKVLLDELLAGSKRKQVVRIRQAICFLGVTRLGLSGARIARVLGIEAQSARRAAVHGSDAIKHIKLKEKDLFD